MTVFLEKSAFRILEIFSLCLQLFMWLLFYTITTATTTAAAIAISFGDDRVFVLR
jgi:hypothetical protein